MTLVPVDPTSEVAVTSYLEQAKKWLATAVENTGPEQIARAKAEIATAAEATKQLNLSKEIQLDAQEMVRRAEYALGKSIRKGQAEGSIISRGQVLESYDRHSGDRTVTTNSTKARPTDFASAGELGGSDNTPGIYTVVDAVESDEHFSEAIEAAKAEGNLSRRNLLRKVKGAGSGAVTRDMRAEMIREMADQGYSSRQMPAKVGVTEETVRQIARDFDIEIPADRSIRKSRRVDSNRIVANTVTALEGLVDGIALVDFGDLDVGEASQWADSLTHSLTELRRFVKQIKETTHD